MWKYKLKDLAKRGGAFALAVGLLGAIGLWSFPSFASADALNPLTERSLLLSSSAPGYIDKDAAGNVSSYAPPGSGPNGKKTGETFSFKVSTDSVAEGRPIKAFTLQYCTKAAGHCVAPGDNDGDYDPDENDPTGASSTRLLNETPTTGGWDNEQSDLNVVGTFANAAGATPAAGEFSVVVDGVASTGWTMAAINAEAEDTGVFDAELTGKNNLIRLTNSSGVSPNAGDVVQIVFEPSSSIYITNPGSEAFFVKINTYDDATVGNLIPADMPPNTHIIDGGVTVANVMTKSIEIRTKVLETMAFSVGTVNPDMLNQSHGTCDEIPTNAPIEMGNPLAEFSLEVGAAYDAHSYWRLSSNSSNGAVVYYSGYSLANTVGDQIDGINDGAGTGTETNSNFGEEQFGLAYDSTADALDTIPANNPVASNSPDTLTIDSDYNEGNGTISDGGTAKFSWQPNSLTVPEVIASGNTDVVTCATGKMRYLANIAAATPAGIYTSAVNYLASPQY